MVEPFISTTFFYQKTPKTLAAFEFVEKAQ